MRLPLPSRSVFLSFLGAVSLAYVIGRGQQKTVTVEKIREVEKTAEQKVSAARAEVATVKAAANSDTTHWRTKTVYLPGGVVEVTKEVVREVEKKQEERAAQVVTKTVAVEKVVYRDRLQTVTAPLPKWSVGAAAGLGLDGRLRYGGELGRRVVGPVWVTAGVDVTGRAALLGVRLEF